MDVDKCLCFPCILYYLGEFIWPETEDQHYPTLKSKGFTEAEQKAIAEEWYWIAFERQTAVDDYMRGVNTLRDGCWWRTPPPRSSQPSTTASSSASASST